MKFTSEERNAVSEAAKAAAAGNFAQVHEQIKKVPLPPELAQVFKEQFGPDFLREHGYNLSAAEKAYGQDWLRR